MDDLTRQLHQILSDPQQMRQIQSMLGALGMGGSPSENPPTPAEPPPAPSPAPLPDAGALRLAGQVAPLLSRLNQEDDATRLLRALRPLLSPARQQKLDEALRLLQLLRLLPLLRSGGLLSGLL